MKRRHVYIIVFLLVILGGSIGYVLQDKRLMASIGDQLKPSDTYVAQVEDAEPNIAFVEPSDVEGSINVFIEDFSAEYLVTTKEIYLQGMVVVGTDLPIDLSGTEVLLEHQIDETTGVTRLQADESGLAEFELTFTNSEQEEEYELRIIDIIGPDLHYDPGSNVDRIVTDTVE